MKRLFCYNYDFEFELAGLPPEAAQGRIPWHFLNRQALLLWPLLSPGDALAVYEEPPEELTGALAERLGFRPQWFIVRGNETNRIGLDLKPQADEVRRFELIPWGWSPSMEELAGAPASLMAARGNSKLFGHRLRPPEFAPRAAVVDEVGILPDMIEQALSDWGSLLIKHPWGSSGRLSERLSESPSPKQLERWSLWINDSGGLLIEEMLAVKAEWSLQYDLAPAGPRLLGITRLYTDQHGAHRANAAGLTPPEGLKPLLAGAEAVLRVYCGEGFRGPAGVDVLETEAGFYLGESNLRLTMGRLALEWSRALEQPGRLEVGTLEAPEGTLLLNSVDIPNSPKVWRTYFYPSTSV